MAKISFMTSKNTTSRHFCTWDWDSNTTTTHVSITPPTDWNWGHMAYYDGIVHIIATKSGESARLYRYRQNSLEYIDYLTITGYTMVTLSYQDGRYVYFYASSAAYLYRLDLTNASVEVSASVSAYQYDSSCIPMYVCVLNAYVYAVVAGGANTSKIVIFNKSDLSIVRGSAAYLVLSPKCIATDGTKVFVGGTIPMVAWIYSYAVSDLAPITSVSTTDNNHQVDGIMCLHGYVWSIGYGGRLIRCTVDLGGVTSLISSLGNVTGFLEIPNLYPNYYFFKGWNYLQYFQAIVINADGTASVVKGLYVAQWTNGIIIMTPEWVDAPTYDLAGTLDGTDVDLTWEEVV